MQKYYEQIMKHIDWRTMKHIMRACSLHMANITALSFP